MLHYILRHRSYHHKNYDDFYREEIENRKIMIYPPFCDIAQISCQSADNALARQYIKEIADNIKSLTSGEYNDVKIIVLGPCAAAVPKVGGKYRYRIVIKCKNNNRFREMITKATDTKKIKDVSFGIDINPETII